MPSPRRSNVAEGRLSKSGAGGRRGYPATADKVIKLANGNMIPVEKLPVLLDFWPLARD